MPVIMSTVGRRATNQPADVICIQTALSQARVPGVKSFWPGKIDGRPSADLEDAITLFQHSQRIAATGRIGRTCPTCMRLESVLPAAFKGLDSKANAAANSNTKPNTNAASNINGQTLGAGRRPVQVPTRPNAPLPRDQLLKKLALSMHLKADLTAYRGAAYRELGLVVSFVEMTTDVSGVLRFELDMTPAPSQLEVRQLRLLAGRFPSFNALSGDPLILGTTRPIRFRQGTLRPGAAGHKMFADTINKNGGATHDAAALQAALINIARPDGPKFWTGAVDGNGTVKLSTALADFQVAADIQPTGSVGPGTPTEQALIAALPDGLKRLKGVKDLPVAFVSGAGSAPTVPFTRLPKTMHQAVIPVAKAVEDALGLPLVLRQAPQDKVAHIAVLIGVGNGVFLDTQGRPIPHDKAPDAVKAAVNKALQADPRLKLDPNAVTGRLVLTMQADGELMLESHEKALEGPPYPTLAELGTTCALVGRPLALSPADKFAGHLFIVAGAQFTGDPNATVYSFGQAATKLIRPKDTAEDFLGIVPRDATENMMGQVGLKSGQFRGGDLSRDTHLEDVKFWENLDVRTDATGKTFLPQEMSPIIAPESAVRWHAENVVLDFVYELFPDSGYGSNSNAAAQAVANRASEQGLVALPGGSHGLAYPGASNWAEVNFGNSMP